MGFVEFSSVFGVGFVILELFGCCVFFVYVNRCLWVYEFKPDLSFKGKRSSRDDDTDHVVGLSHGVDDDGFGFIGDGETKGKKQKENK